MRAIGLLLLLGAGVFLSCGEPDAAAPQGEDGLAGVYSYDLRWNGRLGACVLTLEEDGDFTYEFLFANEDVGTDAAARAGDAALRNIKSEQTRPIDGGYFTGSWWTEGDDGLVFGSEWLHVPGAERASNLQFNARADLRDGRIWMSSRNTPPSGGVFWRLPVLSRRE